MWVQEHNETDILSLLLPLMETGYFLDGVSKCVEICVQPPNLITNLL